MKTREIASLCIHVERAINKIKDFHIWDGVTPLHQAWPCKSNVVCARDIMQCATQHYFYLTVKKKHVLVILPNKLKLLALCCNKF